MKSRVGLMIQVVGRIGAVHTDEVVKEHIGLFAGKEIRKAPAPVGHQWQVIVFHQTDMAIRESGHPFRNFPHRAGVALFFDRMPDRSQIGVGDENGLGGIQLVKILFAPAMNEEEVGGIEAKFFPVVQKRAAILCRLVNQNRPEGGGGWRVARGRKQAGIIHRGVRGKTDPMASVFDPVLGKKNRTDIGMMEASKPRTTAKRQNQGFAQGISGPLIDDLATEAGNDPSQKQF